MLRVADRTQHSVPHPTTHGYDSAPKDPRRFRVTNQFLREGEIVAELEASAAWIDLATRKLEPPPELVRALTSPCGQS